MDLSLVNQKELMYRVDGDHQLLKKIIHVFYQTTPLLLTKIECGIVKNDAVLVREAAHSLKGMVSNFSAPSVELQAEKLESIANSGDLSTAHTLFDDLKDELKRLDKALQSL